MRTASNQMAIEKILDIWSFLQIQLKPPFQVILGYFFIGELPKENKLPLDKIAAAGAENDIFIYHSLSLHKSFQQYSTFVSDILSSHSL